ncbi:MAG: GtrA family protein, partial [Treponema sp.]|nr:GtrA family protein [Candidatus Treponema merdequi]
LLLCYLIAYIFAKWIIYKLFASYSISVKDNISMFVGMCLYTGLNYLTQRLIIFKDGKQK